MVFLLAPLLVFAYLSLPRAALALLEPANELGFRWGYVHLTLAYVLLFIGVDAAFRIAGWRFARGILLALLHFQVMLRALEAGLLHEIGIGYSPLFFAHLEWESLRLAVSQYWGAMAGLALLLAAAHAILSRVLAPIPGAGRGGRLAAGSLAILAAMGAAVLIAQSHRLARGDFAEAAFAANALAFHGPAGQVEAPGKEERAALRALGLDFSGVPAGPSQTTQKVEAAGRRPNLILVYLEGFQADLTAAGGSPHPGLTPHLDRFAARFSVAGRFYNAVTPTINALIASLCGILPELSNRELLVDRGYTRNLDCLPDRLARAGYRQVFLGGAHSGFSGKALFLSAHGYDEVWGWQEWAAKAAYAERRNEWGLHDTDLAREALAAVDRLRGKAPFHLTLLTLNTHSPGFRAPDCPVYRRGAVLLNGIHCTDHAMGILLDGLLARGQFERSVIALVGDHPIFPTAAHREALRPAVPSWFGRIFLALHAPNRDLPHRLDVLGYTPDLAPTLLDLLGFPPLPDAPGGAFPFGRSLLGAASPRERLIAPAYEIFRGRMVPPDPRPDRDCGGLTAGGAVLRVGEGPLEPCGRRRIFALQRRWLLGRGLPPGP